MFKDIKYIFAYILPLTAIIAIWFQGILSFSSLIFAFVIIPLLELIYRESTSNEDDIINTQKEQNRYYDILLYLNVPFAYGLIFWYFYTISTSNLAIYEQIGLTASVGIFLGAVGINVAHELGHRQHKGEQFLAKLLLLPNLYLHFIIEHNRGHHLNVATEKDPASSRKNETLYAFYLRSVVGSYISAWRIENHRLRRAKRSILSIHNEMIIFQVSQLLWLIGLGIVFGVQVIPFALGIAVLGFIMLETVNYIEHYGLRREMLTSGRYENVQPWHSWNSNHPIGRIVLYELTRHSDHHFKATRKYQTLRHFKESPQLPLGYPASMLLATIPPLWFKKMNPLVEQYQNNH